MSRISNDHSHQSGQTSKRTVTDPRDAAYRHLSRQANKMPDLSLSDLNTGSLDVRDASLAHAIVDAVLTRWLTLDYIITGLSGKNLSEQEPRMQAVLLGGAAQLLLMDRVPPHAVIDESVEWAKTTIRPGAGGMVNAVLRKVSRTKGERTDSWNHHLDSIPLSDGTGLMLQGIELPANGRTRLVSACSLPTQLIRKWEKQFEDPTQQALHTLSKAPTIINVKQARNPDDISDLGVHQSPNHKVYTGRRADLIDLLSSRSDLWVQDSASSRVVDELKFENDPKIIIDFCAGQGTKTRQLRARFPHSELIATDVDEKRLAKLSDVFIDDEQVRILHVDQIMNRELGFADLVLADVPCSNTGVLARRREARYRPMRQQLARITPTQQEIAGNAYSLLKSGGRLVYSTCSLEAEENEVQAEWISSQLNMSQIDGHRATPQGLPGGEACHYTDGSFSASFVK
tara:strand:+ start:283854 stop:285224 length:1371 start_codon:yes stop_codon:yes gene_type:complete